MDIEQLQKENEELKARIADMQRLCERAYLTITDNYAEYTDGEGLGPTSLIKDLEKVMNGKECRDLRASNSTLANALKDRISKIEELSAYIERLRELNIFGWLSAALEDEAVCSEMKRDIHAAFNAICETQAQSLNHILSKVEEETIERCASYIEDLVTLHDYNAGDAKSAVMFIQRKYKEQFNEG